MYSESTEKALLGAIMLKPEKLDLAKKWIEETGVFYFDFHKNVWDTILSLHDSGEEIDMVTVSHNYPQKTILDRDIGYLIT